MFPRNSPRTVTRVPGGPSLGDIPVTTGGGAILENMEKFPFKKFYLIVNVKTVDVQSFDVTIITLVKHNNIFY